MAVGESRTKWFYNTYCSAKIARAWLTYGSELQPKSNRCQRILYGVATECLDRRGERARSNTTLLRDRERPPDLADRTSDRLTFLESVRAKYNTYQ